MNDSQQISNQTRRATVIDARVATLLCLVVSLISFRLGWRGAGGSSRTESSQELKTVRLPEVSSSSGRQVRQHPSLQINDKAPLVETARERTEAWEQAQISAHIQRTSEQEAQEYAPLFKTLGLDEEKTREILQQLAVLHRGASAANEALNRLNESRMEYDERMRKLLGSERYETYKSFELAKPARREMELLDEFAKGRATQLDPAERELILDAIRTNGATSTELWHGPYDPMPRPQFGDSAVLSFVGTQKVVLQSGAASVLAELNGKVSESMASLVGEYYQRRLANIQQQMDAVKNPEELMKRFRPTN